MRPKRWWNVILTMGLFMALSTPSAQAGPQRPFAPQANRQAFTRPSPRAFATGCNSQPHQWGQPRGNAYGWNDHQRQWQHHGNGYGWSGPQRQWNQHRNAYGQDGQHHQWQQPRPSVAQGGRLENRQFQPPNGGQHYNAGYPYNRAGYQVPPQSSPGAPGSSDSSHNASFPAGQTGTRSGFHHANNSGNAPLVQSNSPQGVIRAADYQESQGMSGRTDR